MLNIFRKNRFLFWFLSMPIILTFTVLILRTNICKNKKIDYNTVGSQKVSHINFYNLVEKVPKSIAYDVRHFFKTYPESKSLLVHQDVDLSNVGNVFLHATKFFSLYNIKNYGKLNYVFKLPDSDYFVKICGPNNRFFYSVHSYGIQGVNLYIRHQYSMQNGVMQDLYNYVDLHSDKEKIRDYFYHVCTQKNILEKSMSKARVKEIITQVAGALPQAILRGFVYSLLEKKFLLDTYDYTQKTVESLFEEVLDYTFYLVDQRCYKKSDLEGKSFVNSYNIANRVFSCKRFEEAIDTFGLDKLEKPPRSYIMNVSDTSPDSCADKDVVLLQEIIQENVPFSVFLENRELLNQVFTYDAVKQLLKAMKYAGLWDVTGDNIQVNRKTKKITYIDFEPKNDILPDQWFNNSEYKRRMNLGYLMLQFTKRFEPGTPQRAAVDSFINENCDIDIAWYNREFNKKMSKYKFNNRGWAMPESLLGKLLRYDDCENQQALSLCATLGKKLEVLT